MSLSVLDARPTENGLAITFATERGLEMIEGSHAQLARLAEVMGQVSALAAANDTERVWVEDVTVGDATIRLGLNPCGQARLRIVR